ncbi:MAG: hypothetical protein P4L99_05010 [Chthoniobacter sp.]|nr:hypothetical protein [Chthoniobacter sp.]
MSAPALSPETSRRVELLFAPEQRAEVTRLLFEECGNNLPFLENRDEQGLERFQFAALKLSGGDLHGLREAIDLAKLDWRDLLVAAGFAHDPLEHQRWIPPAR